MAFSYYSFRRGGELTGLIRRDGGSVACAIDGQGWVERPSLLGLFLGDEPWSGPDPELEKIDAKTARRLGREYGVPV